MVFIVLGLCRFRPESFEHPAWFLMLRFGLLGVVVVGFGAWPIRLWGANQAGLTGVVGGAYLLL